MLLCVRYKAHEPQLGGAMEALCAAAAAAFLPAHLPWFLQHCMDLLAMPSATGLHVTVLHIMSAVFRSLSAAAASLSTAPLSPTAAAAAAGGGSHGGSGKGAVAGGACIMSPAALASCQTLLRSLAHLLTPLAAMTLCSQSNNAALEALDAMCTFLQLPLPTTDNDPTSGAGGGWTDPGSLGDGSGAFATAADVVPFSTMGTSIATSALGHNLQRILDTFGLDAVPRPKLPLTPSSAAK